MTNALNETTTLAYGTNGYLTNLMGWMTVSIMRPNPKNMSIPLTDPFSI
jgi:hypothetical protein